MCQPLRDLTQTDVISTTLVKVKDKHNLILHCYGVPGSGKSQLVRTLAKKFPYLTETVESNPLCIKWHVQCKDTNDDLKKELQSLVQKLHENHFVDNPSICQNIEKEFGKNQAKLFLEVLLNCQVPILLILEDPTEETRQLLRNLFELLNAHFQENSSSFKFHIYVTSRLKSPIMPWIVSQRMECYKIINIKGFNLEEGINYLKRSDVANADAREDLFKVFERFSGMPLGMLAAKSYCQYTGLNYKEYLNLSEDISYDISTFEREAILQEYGQSAEHIFQAIVMVFMPEEAESSYENRGLHWSILSCISFFHYDSIPRFLLEFCCHTLRQNQVNNPSLRNKVDAGILTRKLLERSMCIQSEDVSLTFHEVVLNAFRFAQKSTEYFNVMKKAIEVLCGLVSNDMRRKENCDRMYMLRPHLVTVLRHIENHEEILGNDSDSSLLKAVACHLYEVAGAVLLHELSSKESENMFLKSLKMIFPDMLHVLQPQIQSVNEIAQKIVERSNQKGSELSQNFILTYASWIKLSHFETKEHEFLRSRSKEDYKEVEQSLQNLDSKGLVMRLQQCDLFLSDEVFRSIFFAERFASIVHRWSRYCLYGCHGKEAAIEKGLWLSSLSNAVSVRIREVHGVHLMTEWLSCTAGLIPLLMKQKDKPRSLQQAHYLGKSMLEKEELTLYENGLLVKAFCPPGVTQMYLLRHLVLVNARLVNSINDEAFLLEADQKCDQLFDLANERMNISSGVAFVICGKYHGAKKDFPKAIHCFNKFFELAAIPGFKPKFYTECWAVYNYARCVCSYPTPRSREVAIERCSSVLNANKLIKDDLKIRLEEVLNQL